MHLAPQRFEDRNEKNIRDGFTWLRSAKKSKSSRSNRRKLIYNEIYNIKNRQGNFLSFVFLPNNTGMLIYDNIKLNQSQIDNDPIILEEPRKTSAKIDDVRVQ